MAADIPMMNQHLGRLATNQVSGFHIPASDACAVVDIAGIVNNKGADSKRRDCLDHSRRELQDYGPRTIYIAYARDNIDEVSAALELLVVLNVTCGEQ